MRVITSLQGSVAIGYSPDDATSDVAMLTRDLIAFVGQRYKFSLIPEVPAGLILPPQNSFMFQVGETLIKERKQPINQLTLTQGAVVLTAKDTDVADLIVQQMIEEIDREFGTNIGSSIRIRQYISIIAVEFSPGLEMQISALLRAQAVLNQNMHPDKPYFFWRLTFGTGSQSQQQQVSVFSVEDIRNFDFVIERRAGEPPSLNRYHAAAPLSTMEHERVLRMIEEALRDPS
jgi:hypothetical protein